MRTALLLHAILVLAAPDLVAQDVLTTIAGDSWGFMALDTVADLDGDGAADVVVGSPLVGCSGKSWTGKARVYSSGTGVELLQVEGECGASLGYAVLGLDDVDGDGWPDVLVAVGDGYIEAYSGATGATLYRRHLPLTSFHDAFEQSTGHQLMDQVGDIDGDGVGDFVISLASAARVCSGRDGATISELPASGLVASYVNSVAGLGDVDLDGIPDAAASDLGSVGGAPTKVSVFSARSGTLLFETSGEATPPGETPDGYGRGVAGPGDVNADGRADVLVSMDRDLSKADLGVVRVVSGDGGLLVMGIHPDFLYGPSAPTLSWLGDLNGDGFADPMLAIVGTNTGHVEVHSGFDGSVLMTFDSPPGEYKFGENLAGAGDVSGDGVPDLVVGGWFNLLVVAGASDAWVLPSLHPTLLALPGGPGENAGSALARLGDVDGDGREDFAYGAPGGLGAVRVVSGWHGDALLAVPGADAGADFGDALAAVGDIDGDGVTDLLAGAPRSDAGGAESGDVRLLSGASGALLWAVAGFSGEQFGASVAGVGDVDLDGIPDVVVGAPRADVPGKDAGAARLLDGATGAQLLAWTGDANGDTFGRSVAGPGDVDGDGTPDVAVGAPKADGPAVGSDNGRVRLASGASGATLFSIEAPDGATALGAALSAFGDQDGDGVPDLLAGAPSSALVSTPPGQAFLFSGAGGGTLLVLSAGAPGQGFGRSVGAADIDGDGRSDVLAGAPDSAAEPGAWAFSGADGALLLAVPAQFTGEALGMAVCGVDANGDGHVDLAVGAPQAAAGAGRVDVVSPVPQWTTLPVGLAGAAGVPSLTGTGTLIPGEVIGVTLAGAAPLAPGRLFAGTQQDLMPFKGGVLVPAPLVWIDLVTDASGAAAWSGAWPGGLPAGSSIYLQAWIVDVQAVQGVSASNGLRGHVP